MRGTAMPTKNDVLDVLQGVEDPELMMSVVDLGLIYRVAIDKKSIEIDFTLTSPGCPAGDMIKSDIEQYLGDAFSLSIATNLVWSPVWNPEFMSDEAKITLGYPV
jgi:metal-sulfur cluster biosynthetic enzyme